MYLQCIYVYCMYICNERKKTKLVCGGSLLDCCLLLAPAQPLSYQIDLRDQQIAGEAFCQEIWFPIGTFYVIEYRLGMAMRQNSRCASAHIYIYVQMTSSQPSGVYTRDGHVDAGNPEWYGYLHIFAHIWGYSLIYGSVSRGRGKWPFCVIFFKK